MERDSIIQAKGYRGSFVHPDALENCQKDHSSTINTMLSNVINELRTLGITDSELRIAFNELLSAKTVNPTQMRGK